jgi:autotransporter adhesin
MPVHARTLATGLLATVAFAYGSCSANAQSVDTAIATNAGALVNAAEDVASAQIAIGTGSDASGSFNNTAVGNNADARSTLGRNTAIGAFSEASGDSSTAVGVGSEATGYQSSAFGADASATGGGGIAVGYGADVSGANSASIGVYSKATGNYATATGFEAQALANDSVAYGALANTAGAGGVALGASANATGVESTAIGHAAIANGANSVALGSGSVADRANTVSVGTVGAERQIANVAAGTYDTDAVNVAQLKAVQKDVDDLRAESRHGIAAAMAMASVPMPSAPGKVAWGVNAATFRGAYAGSFSTAYRLNTAVPFVASASVGYAGDRNLGVRVGLSGEF